MNDQELELTAIQQRRTRLVQWMQSQQLDWVVFRLPEHVQYFTGARFAPVFQSMLAASADGHTWLVAPENRVPDHHAADEVITYEARWHSTLRNDQSEAACTAGAEIALESRP